MTSSAQQMIRSAGGLPQWSLFAAQAGIGLAIGLLLLIKPGKSITFAAVALGVYLILAGLIRFGVALLEARQPSWSEVFDLTAVIIGIVLLADPDRTVRALTLIVGLYLVVRGVAALAGLLLDRPREGVHAVRAALCVVAGSIVVVWPGPSITFVASVLGVWLILSAIAEAAIAARLKGSGSLGQAT
jgi:uncharacterized membrane protein HdeD (DUF308 family)